MTDIEFRSDMRVTYIDSMGDDKGIARAARASVGNDGSDRPHEGLVRRLWADQHTSTFEHNVLTVMVEVPIFVAREWHRHRTFAYNEISARYSEVAPVFYVPGEDRPLVQTGKAMDYRRELGDMKQEARAVNAHRAVAEGAWDEYQAMLEAGIAREVARNVLPVSMYTRFYATANLRNWMHFLAVRTDEPALWEIRDAARQGEAIIAGLWPVAHGAFPGSQGGTTNGKAARRARPPRSLAAVQRD